MLRLLLLGIPTLIFVILGFAIALIAFWIWALVDCINSKKQITDKLIWIIIIFLFSFIGAVLYWLFGRKKQTFVIKGKNLYRSRKNRIIAGVCGGLGNYFGIDPVIIRILWLLLILYGGSGILIYIIAWIIIPEGK